MTIRAVLRQGMIQPMEPLPPEWRDGQELVIEEPGPSAGAQEVRQWARDLDDAAAKIPDEEHERFLHAIDEIERESKEAVRRQWGQS